MNETKLQEILRSMPPRNPEFQKEFAAGFYAGCHAQAVADREAVKKHKIPMEPHVYNSLLAALEGAKITDDHNI